MEWIVQGNTTTPLRFLLVLSSDHITGATGKTPTVTIAKSDAGFTTPNGAIVEVGNGWYQIAANAADADTIGSLLIHADASGCDPADEELQVVTAPVASALSGGISGPVTTDTFVDLYTDRLDRELGTDDNSVLFTTARRKQAINEGLAQFVDMTECLTRWSTITVTGGTAEYDLNSTTSIADLDFGRFSKDPVEFYYTDASSNVTVITGDDLTRRDINWLDRFEPGWRHPSTVASTTAQLPQHYYLRPDGAALYLGFWPTPSTGSSASASVRVPYIAQTPTLVNDADVAFSVGGAARLDLRPYTQAVVHYAAHQLEKYRRDEQASASQLQQFQGYIARYVAAWRVKGGRTLNAARTYFGNRAARV